MLQVQITKKGEIIVANNGTQNLNLTKTTPKSVTPTSYCGYQLNLTENLVANQTYTLQLWDVDVSHSAKTEAQTGVWVYWGGGSVHLFNWAGATYFKNGHADYLVKTFTVTSIQASGSGATNLWLNLYNSVGYVEGTMSMSIGKWKLEKGSVPTGWIPDATNSLYTNFNMSTQSTNSGFIELDNKARIYKERIDANQFYEI